MFSTHWKLVVLLHLSILFKYTVGISTGIVENSKHLKSNFENGSVPDNYQNRKSHPHSSSILRHNSSPSYLDPVYATSSHKKAKADGRSGISVEKAPPDLQFGLAFTVPFVSLSTDRLLSTVSGHRGYNSLSDIMSILKLNVGGLVLAAVVGVAAILFLPAVFAGKGGGLGGLSSLFQGNFMPGFLDHIMPGLGFNKPLGFGQYDNTVYNDPYGNNLPYRINRKDTDGRSRTNDNQNNGTNVFSLITNFVGEYIGQAQSCALYTMCARGRDEKRGSSISSTSGSNSGGRGRRKMKLTTLDHAIEVIQGVSDDVPGLEQFKEAYKIGQNDKIDCAAKFKDCSIADSVQITNYINNIGEYIFS